MKQLSLFDLNQYERVPSHYDIEDGFQSDNSITEATTLTNPVIELSVPASGLTVDAVNLYSPAGTAKGRHQYFRFSWRSRSGVFHRHIPGGNSTSLLVQSRAEKVRCAIADGKSSAEVLELIRSWSKSKPSV